MLLFLANALFHAKRYQQCKEILMKAIHTQPQNPALWYNLAVAQRQLAAHIVRDERPSIEDMRNALKELNQVCTCTHTHSLSLPACLPACMIG